MRRCEIFGHRLKNAFREIHCGEKQTAHCHSRLGSRLCGDLRARRPFSSQVKMV